MKAIEKNTFKALHSPKKKTNSTSTLCIRQKKNDATQRNETTRHDTRRRKKERKKKEERKFALIQTLEPERPLLSRMQLHFPLRFTKPQLPCIRPEKPYFVCFWDQTVLEKVGVGVLWTATGSATAFARVAASLVLGSGLSGFFLSFFFLLLSSSFVLSPSCVASRCVALRRVVAWRKKNSYS